MEKKIWVTGLMGLILLSHSNKMSNFITEYVDVCLTLVSVTKDMATNKMNTDFKQHFVSHYLDH